MTPVTVSGRPSSVTAVPTMAGEAPRRFHSASEMTTPLSSMNQRPRRGLTPTLCASEGVTAAPETNCGSPDALRLELFRLNHPNTSKLVVLLWYSIRSTNVLEEYRPGSVVRAPNSMTNRSLCGYGRGRSMTPLMMVKIAVAEPMPTANATTAMRPTAFAAYHDCQACDRALVMSAGTDSRVASVRQSSPGDKGTRYPVLVRVSPAAALSLVSFALVRFTIVPALAQDSAPRFDVASVKPNIGTARGIQFRPPPPDGIVLTNYPLESIIRFAYSVQPFRLEGAPAWTNEERFDIAAKATGPISDEQRRLMMRALLVDRFRLKARFETREKTIYVMTLARADKQLGPGLKPRPECATSPCTSGGSGRQDAIQLRAVTLTQLADGMISTLRGELVRDETDVPGAFDVEMSWRPETSTDPDDARPAFVTAMQEQLGLKLDPMRRPVEVLVVESIDRPTPD